MRKALLLFVFLGTQLVPALPAVATERVLWHYDYNKALLDAKKAGKPIFVDFFAAWCVWCKKLEEEVYSSHQFVQLIKNYIPLRIDIEDPESGTHLAQNYRVETLPTLLVIEPGGQLINRIGGFLNVKELSNDLSMIQNLVNREKSNPADWAAVQTLAEEYLLRDMNADAETRFRKVLKAPVSSVEKESAQFSLALAQYYQQKNADALNTLTEYVQSYPNGTSGESALLLLSQVHLEMDELEKAKQTLKQFLQKYPDSNSAGRAQEVLTKL